MLIQKALTEAKHQISFDNHNCTYGIKNKKAMNIAQFLPSRM